MWVTLDDVAKTVSYYMIITSHYIVIIIFFNPRYQGSRGVWKKIRRKCVGVTITPGSPQPQKNHVAARR